MKVEAEQGRRRHEVLSGGRGGGRIPVDVVSLILTYLPLKSLGRFKAVSRGWCQLIQTLNLPPLFLGLFYEIYRRGNCHKRRPYREDIFEYIVRDGDSNSSIIDPAFSFLPMSDSSLRVVDCCNGLLLLTEPDGWEEVFYICNPLTKSWTRLRGLDAIFSWLDFDPEVSPNFKIFSLKESNAYAIKIRVLSSETPTKTWEKYAPVKFRDPSFDKNYSLMGVPHPGALWKGSLYLLFGRNCAKFDRAGRVMRFDLLEDHTVYRQIIKFPKGTRKPIDVAIGKNLRNKLCLAGLDWINNNNHNSQSHMVARMRVWSISKRDQNVWVLEHDSIINSSHLLCPPDFTHIGQDFTHIGQFHPFLDAVFIQSRNMVYAYNMKNLSLDEICDIASNKYEVHEASVLPFIPSMVDYSTQWEKKCKRKRSFTS